MIGDTESGAQQLQDEEIDFLVDSSGSAASAAVAACRALAAKYARRVHEEVGDLKLYNEQLFDHYTKLMDQLATESMLGSLNGLPSAGGVYAAEKEAYAANAALVQPNFTLGIHDYD
jgi:hypothetical protein